MNKHLIILSGGVGKRFGSDIPKQYTRDDHNNMIITISSIPFVGKSFQTVVFVAHSDFWDVIKEEVASMFPDAKVLFVSEGKERQDSINNGVKALVEWIVQITADDHVFIQESVRPFVTNRLVNDLIAAPAVLNNVTPAINPAVLFGRKSGNNNTVSMLMPKTELLELQLPKRYSLSELNRLIDKKNYDSTKLLDESELFLMDCQEINIIPGSTFNVKITYPEDKNVLKK